jgi:cyclic pyranopterin monophosphate synthase
MAELTHFDEKGASRMVDVSGKDVTERVSVAVGRVLMAAETFRLIKDKGSAKGDVLEVARIAGIMAAKKTSGLIPLCHPLPLEKAVIDFKLDEKARAVEIRAEAKVTAKTGVEMEALTAVTVAALTIYDMCKAVDRGMKITGICLMEKSGGRSGHFARPVKTS